ncbi:MAG TPA: hypothetical protein VES36_04305 [Candidatus Limnocylindrales bacterium]|nr:hypothetical protein [Candidatus Limnocylindrales bacterium]
MSTPPDDDLVPVSVQLGQVVPPDDPEDWTQPLTWAAAGGMLAAPALALAWFWLAAPTGSTVPDIGTWIVAGVLVSGGVLTGATQLGALRAFTGTLAAALFAALGTVAVGLLTAGERQVGSLSPTLAHAFAATLAGLAGAVAASPLAARLASAGSRAPRIMGPTAVGVGVSLLVVPLLFGR